MVKWCVEVIDLNNVSFLFLKLNESRAERTGLLKSQAKRNIISSHHISSQSEKLVLVNCRKSFRILKSENTYNGVLIEQSITFNNN